MLVEAIVHSLEHAVEDCLGMLPFLFLAFLLIEVLEHYSGNLVERCLLRFRWLGPLAGALLGCVPQCGFSVIAANLFAGGMISTGTIVATFLSTSDEAILLLMGETQGRSVIWRLLVIKVIVAAVAGIVIDLFMAVRKQEVVKKDICKECGCHDHGILMPAVRHVVKLIGYLFLITFGLHVLIEVAGVEQLSVWLLTESPIQPLLAGVIGLIPNCAVSVMLTTLYMEGIIGFGAVLAGLCSGAGVGMIVLWKMNENKKECAMITGLVLVVGILAGFLAGWM